jgi:hypothetical protein
MRIDQIRADFVQRIAFYESAYTPLDAHGPEADVPFMRITDIGKDIEVCDPSVVLGTPQTYPTPPTLHNRCLISHPQPHPHTHPRLHVDLTSMGVGMCGWCGGVLCEWQLHKVAGALQHRIIRFLMSIHPRKRSIYLTRHGESLYNKSKRLGGDSGLSQAGIRCVALSYPHISLVVQASLRLIRAFVWLTPIAIGV